MAKVTTFHKIWESPLNIIGFTPIAQWNSKAFI